MSELPNGWRSLRLIDAGIWLSGGTPFTEEPRYWNGDTPWISAASLKEFHVNDSERYVTQLGVLAGTRTVPAGTVLFVVRGMSLKSEFRVGVTQRTVAFGQDCKAIIPAAGIDPTFLALAIRSRTSQILGMVDEAGHGTGRLPTDLIAKLEVGVPELAEQRQIAGIIEALDEAISAGKCSLGKLRSIRTGLLEEFFRSGAEGWRESTLGEVSIGRGEYGSNLPAQPYDEKLPRYVRITDIDDDGHLSGKAPVSIPKVISRPFILGRGDLLIARTGFTTGKSYLYSSDDGECAFASYLVRFRIDDKKALPRYVFHWTQSSLFSGWINRMIREVGQRNISAREYVQLPLPVPPIVEQCSIGDRMQTIDIKIRRDKAGIMKLQDIKSGLMRDLLMGQVRVVDRKLVGVGSR